MTLQTEGLQTLEQIRAFLEGSQPMGFEIPSREAANDLIAQTLRRFGCARLGRADKGLVRRYLCKVTGRSRAQMTRLIAQFRRIGRIKDRRGAPARPFPRRYTREDVLLLAEVDNLHSTLSGPATRKLCGRAYTRFGDQRCYARPRRDLQRPPLQPQTVPNLPLDDPLTSGETGVYSAYTRLDRFPPTVARAWG